MAKSAFKRQFDARNRLIEAEYIVRRAAGPSEGPVTPPHPTPRCLLPSHTQGTRFLWLPQPFTCKVSHQSLDRALSQRHLHVLTELAAGHQGELASRQGKREGKEVQNSDYDSLNT